MACIYLGFLLHKRCKKMTKDYKHRLQQRQKQQRSVPGWFWLLTGLLLGLFVAILLYIKQDGDPSTHERASGAQTTTQPGHGKETVQKLSLPAPKPRFDFYTILPEVEVVVPEEELQEKPSQAAPQAAQSGPSNTYVLQVGSFRKAQDADGLRAKLILQGFDAHIERVNIRNQDWYRVRLGPFNDLRRLNEVRARLKEQRTEALLIRLKG